MRGHTINGKHRGKWEQIRVNRGHLEIKEDIKGEKGIIMDESGHIRIRRNI